MNITEYLRSHGICGEVSEFENKVSVDIEWGDWKHEHGYCDYLMKEIGYTRTEERVYEEDGSDCYSAVHEYKKVG